MNATKTGTRGPVTAAAGEKFDVVESVTRFYTKGIERLTEVQKSSIDLAVEQNAELVATWKKQTAGYSAIPGLALLDLATTAFERCVNTQKGAIDLMSEQTNALAGMVKESVTTATKAVESGVAMAQETIEQAVTAQKTAVDLSAKQTKAAFETAKQQFGYAGTPVGAAADSMERGVDVVFGAQKALLDLLKEPIQIKH